MIYLDNCATTKPRREVIEEMTKAMEDEFANPSSLHSFGHSIEKKLEKSRDTIANFLNVRADEIFFTSGGTESNNIFIKGVVTKSNHIGRKILTTILEHPAVTQTMKNLESHGYEIVYLRCLENGQVDLNHLEEEMDDNVCLVSIIHVNNEIGTINDIKVAGQIIKRINKNTIFHVDGVQALGKITIDLKDLGVDGYSVSAHKIHGPKGVGALYIRKGLNLEPLIHGGNQEKGLRSGTENTLGIFGFSKAIEILEENYKYEEELKAYNRRLIVELLEKNFTDYVINTPLHISPSSILNVSFFYTKGEVIVHYLEQDDIYVSTSSACSGKRRSQSNLEKLNKSKEICEGSIRICLSYENTKRDIFKFMDRLYYAVEDIRKINVR